MTDLTKLADALESMATYNGELLDEEWSSLHEAARILRAAAGVDVAGLMTDRKIAVINFALHRFASHAHQNANAAGQDIQGAYYKKGAFEAFLKDAEDAEELLSKKPYAALESALRMALAARAGWQPIETAPKDGTEIIMSNGKDVSAGSWFGGDDGTFDHDGAPNCDEREAGWMDWSGGMQPDPTRWMPLPAAAPKGTP